MVRNWYVEQTMDIDTDTTVPDFADFLAFARRFLAACGHLHLNEEYKSVGVKTESPSKILASFTGTDTVFPRWLLDITREILRPMATQTAIFLPAFACDYDGRSVVPGLGMSLATTSHITRFVKKLRLSSEDVRPLVAEKLLPAPLMVSDGPYIYANHDDVAGWRYNAFLNTRHLLHGCDGYANASDVHLRKQDRGQDLDIQWITDPAENLLDRWDEPAQIDVSLDVANIPANAPVQNQLFIDLARNGIVMLDHPVLNRNCIIMYYDVDMPTRNVWIDRMISSDKAISTGKPPVESRKISHRYGLEYSRRFPTTQYHSKTPPQRGAPQQTRRFPRKDKKQIPKFHVAPLDHAPERSKSE